MKKTWINLLRIEASFFYNGFRHKVKYLEWEWEFHCINFQFSFSFRMQSVVSEKGIDAKENVITKSKSSKERFKGGLHGF